MQWIGNRSIQLAHDSLRVPLSSDLQEAVFRCVLSRWQKRWPKAKTLQLALGNPLLPQSPMADLIDRLKAAVPLALAPYAKCKLSDETVVVGIAGARQPTNTADIVVWGNGYDTTELGAGREFRTEYLQFVQESPRQTTWQYVRERQPPTRSLAVLTFPQSGVQVVCRINIDPIQMVDWFWYSPNELLVVKHDLQTREIAFQRIDIPSGRMDKGCKLPPTVPDRIPPRCSGFSRFGKWFSYISARQLVLASTQTGEVRILPWPDDGGHYVAMKWISDEEFVRIATTDDKSNVTLYTAAKRTTEEKTWIFNVGMFGCSIYEKNRAGEVIVTIPGNEQSPGGRQDSQVALRLDATAPSLRKVTISPAKISDGVLSRVGDKLFWISDAASADANFVWKALWISGAEGEGKHSLAAIAIPDNYRMDSWDSPKLEPQWSPDERYLVFIRDSIFWRLPVK